ncbi:iron-containing alcohol dehydrogenase [Tunturibacter psychrotolerans]|uniref:Iron-containing alcohol dehydrogenase n=1 Tax=Tunturiibacter psychrotolerans TaxID=3069686 RepID=A0AAU7ZMK4_9BACT
MRAEIRIPSILKIGGGSFSEVAALLSRLQCRRPLIVTDPFLMNNGLPEQLRTQIRDAGLISEIFHETHADPTTAIVEEGVRVFLKGGHDSLVSLGGGGSPIDTAKAIGMLATNGGRVRDFKAPNAPTVRCPTHFAIPTTAGTGSEVTRFTVITDVETEEKMLIAGDVLLPTVAVVDYELTLTMPPRLTADTGTDSLTHAIEAYVSRKASPFTDALALSAMKTIWRELPVSFHEPGNRTSREAMMLAATQAGIAFSNASVALVHGMSRPLGAHFHVPHGLSNAMLLPVVTAFSVKAAVGRYAECARTMGVTKSNVTDEVAVDQLIRSLYSRNAELKVPSPRQFGIDQERYFALIPTMTAQAFASGSPQNNPRVPESGEVEAIYRQAWQ